MKRLTNELYEFIRFIELSLIYIALLLRGGK